MRRSRKPLYGFEATFGAEVPGPQWRSQNQLFTRGNAALGDVVNRCLDASTNVNERHVLQKYVPPTFPREVSCEALFRWVVEVVIRHEDRLLCAGAGVRDDDWGAHPACHAAWLAPSLAELVTLGASCRKECCGSKRRQAAERAVREGDRPQSQPPHARGYSWHPRLAGTGHDASNRSRRHRYS
jgi:hypothetical protein